MWKLYRKFCTVHLQHLRIKLLRLVVTCGIVLVIQPVQENEAICWSKLPFVVTVMFPDHKYMQLPFHKCLPCTYICHSFPACLHTLMVKTALQSIFILPIHVFLVLHLRLNMLNCERNAVVFSELENLFLRIVKNESKILMEYHQDFRLRIINFLTLPSLTMALQEFQQYLCNESCLFCLTGQSTSDSDQSFIVIQIK